MRPKAGVIGGSRFPDGRQYMPFGLEIKYFWVLLRKCGHFALNLRCKRSVFGQAKIDFRYPKTDFGQTEFDLGYPEIDFGYPNQIGGTQN